MNIFDYDMYSLILGDEQLHGTLISLTCLMGLEVCVLSPAGTCTCPHYPCFESLITCQCCVTLSLTTSPLLFIYPKQVATGFSRESFREVLGCMLSWCFNFLRLEELRGLCKAVSGASRSMRSPRMPVTVHWCS